MQIPLAARDALVHELAQLLPHVVSGHDLVLDVAQEEHGRPGRDDQDLGGGVPLEGAEECEGPEEGHHRGDHAWEREKCVFRELSVELREGERYTSGRLSFSEPDKQLADRDSRREGFDSGGRWRRRRR